MIKLNNLKEIPDPQRNFFTYELLEWFEDNARNFSWRKENDPFKILLAEVMLQRTKADQVLPIYNDFVAKFGYIDLLYNINVKHITKYFKKLGLLWRSYRILEMTKYIIEKYDGKIPHSKKDLIKIPGIGEYIADAILVFAFNDRRTVVDSNVIRITSRFFGVNIKGEVRRNKKFMAFCQILNKDLRSDEIKKFNWGLIDFSHSVCKPIPQCNICPLSKECLFYNSRLKIDLVKKYVQ